MRVGHMQVPNRIVMSPMTRYRGNESGVPDPCNTLYYQQRASAGFIVGESNYTEPAGRIAPLATGLYTSEQVAAWQVIVRGVHAAGGQIFTQLVHSGRVSHPLIQPAGAVPVAPSAIRQSDQVRLRSGKVDPVTPRALTTVEIQCIITGFAGAVQRAVEAGFDGVELHAGSGFLHNQFLSSNSNARGDGYGGAATNRCRFVMETLGAMTAVNGPEYVGIKIAPTFSYHDMHDSDPVETYGYLCRQISGMGLAYVHVQIPPRFLQSERRDIDVLELVRSNYDGVVMTAGDFDRHSAAAAIRDHRCDLVAFGRRYIANPDLVERFRVDCDENQLDEATLYTPGPKGFIDYPCIGESAGLPELSRRTEGGPQ